MKRIHSNLFVLLIIVTAQTLWAQNVGINETGSPPNSKAILDVASSNKGVLIPRLTTTQRMSISPGASEKGLIVFDETVNAYYFFDGAEWKEISGSLWMSDAIGIHRMSNVGINANAVGKDLLHITRPYNDVGPDTTSLYVHRAGVIGDADGGGGTGLDRTGINAALKAFSDYGNPYSAAVAAYAWMDYNNSVALIAGTPNNSTYGIIGYRDNNGQLYSGYFQGDARFEGQLGIGLNPAYALDVKATNSTIGVRIDQTTPNDFATSALSIIASNSGAGPSRGIVAICPGTGNFAFYGLGRGYFSERVGIGTNDPHEPLEIAGTGRVFIGDGGGANRKGLLIDAVEADPNNDYVRLDAYNYGTNSGMELYLPNTVNIGISQGATGYKLSVDGKIMAEEVRVQMSGAWPDYVFTPGYELQPIPELAKSINTLGHLPNLPSAAEIKESGQQLGEVQRKLLEKIEELTLYIIDIEGRLRKVEDENVYLWNQILDRND